MTCKVDKKEIEIGDIVVLGAVVNKLFSVEADFPECGCIIHVRVCDKDGKQTDLPGYRLEAGKSLILAGKRIEAE